MLNFSKIYNFFYTQKKQASNIFLKLFSHRQVLIYSIVILVLNVLIFWGAYFIYTHISGELLFLHYNIEFGIDLIGKVNNIFYYPVLGLVLFLFNLIILIVFLKNKNFKFISYLSLSFLTLCQVLLLAVMASLYLINFR